MAPKRSRDEEEEPVVERSGAGVEAPSEGNLRLMIEAAERESAKDLEIAELKKKIEEMSEQIGGKDHDLVAQHRCFELREAALKKEHESILEAERKKSQACTKEGWDKYRAVKAELDQLASGSSSGQAGSSSSQVGVEELEKINKSLKRRLHQQQLDIGALEDRIEELEDVSYEEKISELEEQKLDLEAHVQEIQSQVEDLNDTIDVEARRYEERISLILASTAAEGSSAIAALNKATAENDSLRAQVTELNTNIGKEKEKNGKLEAEIKDLRQVLGRDQSLLQKLVAEQKASVQLREQLSTLNDKLIEEQKKSAYLYNGAVQLKQTIQSYEAEARAHICAPAVVAPEPVHLTVAPLHCVSVDPEVTVAPSPAAPAFTFSPVVCLTTDPTVTPTAAQPLTFSQILTVATGPVDPFVDALDDLCHKLAGLTLDGSQEEEIIALTSRFADWQLTTAEGHTLPSVIVTDLDAAASTADSISFAQSGSTLLSLPTTPPSSPPAPLSPPLLSSYDAREDVPDIDSWWFDQDHFDENWKPAAFEYRRTRPHCDHCRTRRALRLVGNEWKLPEDFHLKVPCAEHAKGWAPLNDTPGCRWQRWKRHCADCIEADARASGEEGSLPEQLKEKFRCREPSCKGAVHDRIQAEARYVLEEHYRKIEEREAARKRHEEKLDEYRAVYGKFWPAFKGPIPPKNFAYGAVSYGRGGR